MGKSVFPKPEDDSRLQEIIRQRQQQVERECSKIQQRNLTQDELDETLRGELLQALRDDSSKPQELLKAWSKKSERQRLKFLKPLSRANLSKKSND